ncbi:MBOAT family O-acyltransferase [Sphingobacterium bambusae]|uniref:MBOAT family O-acyltransferase n=1 Tax=Sphingobacterium bambusae TaxID=662858 RepID=A0ABW6BJU5_9SPHI|nr:MBOAT family O-acyltransferase [Sphingobacterium bambusae]WPL49365.1 MBOAT family O-acyltransferase [Sphingobacterium bambusae]
MLLSAKYSPIPQIINDSSAFGQEYSENILPLGLSFYALQAISLLIEINKRRYSSKISFKEVSLFCGFFPVSIAGPIHRPDQLIPQFTSPKSIDTSNLHIGIKTLIFGFICKLIVADKLALLVDPVFSNLQDHNGFLVYSSTILYSLQIYFDFWGYSLIAIGLGKCLGYEISINFRNPYASKSYQEFWHRWHISLSKWLRDYVYIPLGGRRRGPIMFVLSICVTFLLSGVWHGISINFILWGAIHAVLFLLDNILVNVTQEKPLIPYRKLLFLLTIPFTWLIFRFEELDTQLAVLNSIFNFSGWSISQAMIYFGSGINLFWITLSVSIMLIAHSKFIRQRIESAPQTRRAMIMDCVLQTAGMLLLILVGDIGSRQFLYFSF